jgi:hypothetical protein
MWVQMREACFLKVACEMHVIEKKEGGEKAEIFPMVAIPSRALVGGLSEPKAAFDGVVAAEIKDQRRAAVPREGKRRRA